MAQTKKSLTETKEKLMSRITELEALALSETLSQENQEELNKAKAQLMQVEDQLATMEEKASKHDPLESERQKLEAEKAKIEAEKAKIEAEKMQAKAQAGPTAETYVVPEGQEKLLHLKVSKGPSFDANTGLPLRNWKTITLNSSEWENLKRCIAYYDYKVVAVLHDPFGDAKQFFEEDNK